MRTPFRTRRLLAAPDAPTAISSARVITPCARPATSAIFSSSVLDSGRIPTLKQDGSEVRPPRLLSECGNAPGSLDVGRSPPPQPRGARSARRHRQLVRPPPGEALRRRAGDLRDGLELRPQVRRRQNPPRVPPDPS